MLWLEQVHGNRVVVAAAADGEGGPTPDEDGGAAPGTGDALVSPPADHVLSVLVADCAAVALASPEGVFAAVHAGWRGLLGGIVARAAETMSSLGASRIEGAVGPCIHPCCYEFSARDLGPIADAFGPSVVGRSARGRPALDLPAAARIALARSGVTVVAGPDGCTGCGSRFFSHRARGEVERQALIVWRVDGRGRP